MKLRVGTRRSRLALAQAQEVADRLAALGWRPELVPMTTAGDRGSDAPLSKAGRKGLFVGEIVRALRDGDVDVAVHSAKDLPAEDDGGVVIAAVPERADARDVLVTRDPGELRDGAVVGTSSLRRRAQLLATHPVARVVDLRGNVDTRLRKLEEGAIDALVLAAAGLERLGVAPAHATPLDVGSMVPAPGQGALAVQCRQGDATTLQAVEPLDHRESRMALQAERSLMAMLGGGCALPLGAFAMVDTKGVDLVAVVARPDGSQVVRVEVHGATPEDAASRAAVGLREAGAEEILAEVRGPS